MFASDSVAAEQDLRLHRAGNVDEKNAAAAGICGGRGFWAGRFLAGPLAENFFDRLDHGGRIEIADHYQQSVFRSVELPIGLQQIVALVGRHLRLTRSHRAVRMRTE